MKKQVGIFLVAALFSAMFIGCQKGDGIQDNTSLKQAVNESAQTLNSAMSTITSSKAFSILTISSSTVSSSSSVSKSSATTDSIYRVYISLDKIKGEYAFKPATKLDPWGNSLIRFFDKVADNSSMIVRMPLSKIEDPRSLRRYNPADTSLTNNFAIAVSDYHNNYNSYWDYDYVLNSEISVDAAVAGNLNIASVVSPKYGIHYTSQYSFAGSYTAKYKYDSGDTTVSSFSILSDDKVLYEEQRLTIKNDTARFGREHKYILTVGNVKIVRKSGNKVAEVYVDDILQTGAVVTVVDKVADSEASVCKKREIQITFEDGTTTTLSALIGDSIADIKTLFDSLHTVYFAAYVVDWIAYDIYYNRI